MVYLPCRSIFDHARPRPLFAFQPSDWIYLAAVILFALTLRLLFYTGYFGSDEVTYVEASARIAAGDWQASNYIGATRYGMNLPVALAIHVFGISEASVNLWPLAASVGEVALVYAIGLWLWGSRPAVVSAALLALLPLHVHFAGRIMADPPLAFFLTLSVAMMLRAADSRSALIYLATGLAWGGAFWVKESVGVLFLPVLLLLTAYRSQISGPWLWTLIGAGMAIALNTALMHFVADNPLHIFAVMKNATLRANGLNLDTSPWYYFRYLFLDIRHTFLLGPMALGAVIFYSLQVLRREQSNSSTQLVLIWALLSAGMFSFAIVSASPMKFIMKQTNYMLIFAAPMALLSGWFLASLPMRIFAPLGTLVAAGSVCLAALEQQAITVFTANSKSAYAYLRDTPSSFLIATTNNVRAIYFYSLLDGRPELRDRAISLSKLWNENRSETKEELTGSIDRGVVYGLLDLQTASWGIKPSGLQKLKDVPACWKPLGVLKPAPLGNGRWFSQTVAAVASQLPQPIGQRLTPTLRSILAPAPAHLFQIDGPCLQSALN